MTLAGGAPIDDLMSSLSVGPRGPVVLQDYSLIEQIQHFDRERIAERVVHAKGAGQYSIIGIIIPLWTDFTITWINKYF